MSDGCASISAIALPASSACLSFSGRLRNVVPARFGAPFNLYEPGTPKGIRLGNTVAGDGAKFKGRGYIQLTGRDNYTRIGQQVGANLVADPQLANDPSIAGLILAQFLKNKESAIRAALANDDLLQARKLVNGGSHGCRAERSVHSHSIVPGGFEVTS
jgi:putative chitinase